MGSATNEFSEILKMAAADTLENLAFTEINPGSDSVLEDFQDQYQGSRISLGTMGNLDMIIGVDLLEEIAVTLFNPPSGNVDAEMLKDTLSEILNIIAGRFLEAVFKGKSDFALGLPEQHLNIPEWNALPLRWVLLADGGKQLAVGISPETHAQ